MPRRKGKGAQHPRLNRRVKKEIPKRVSRRARNRKQNCYCSGWHWSARGGPHRIGSRTSADTEFATGLSGCLYSAPRTGRKVCPDTGAPF